MGVLADGDQFPDFQLDGFDSAVARAQQPLLVVFWQTGCPTSRLTVPFIERIKSAYPGVRVVGVCQDDRHTVDSYALLNGITFKQLSDAGMKVSNAFHVDVVPTYYLTDQTGEVLSSGAGWNGAAIQALADRAAESIGARARPIVLDSDDVPAMKPG
jgi:peroxiredoxin